MTDTAPPPLDAGDGPAAVLARIPEEWGRELRCGPGWWPLLERLDAALAEVDPGYVVLQAKEKFGGLRFYAEVHDHRGPACCAALDDGPLAGRDDVAPRLDEHLAGPVHRAHAADRDARAAAMAALVRGAESEAARTCEQCGRPGRRGRRGGWYATSCDGCAPEGWEPVPDRG